MPNARGKNKARGKRRATKVSKGVHGAKRHPLTELQKVLLGKGGIQRLAAARAKDARR